MRREKQSFLMPKSWSNFPKLSTGTILVLLFILALAVRFLHFPDNIYFGFDQARDAYEAQNIYKNFDLKVVGPPTADPNLFHGPLYWYLIGPIYLLGGGDPAFPAGFLRIYNALGVFLIFWLGKTLFNKKVGLIASLLYIFSFEQTQYAIYFHHPSLAVLTIMLFYGGLSLAIFKKDWRGIPLSLVGYGLSIQAEFQLPYLGIILILLFVIFRKSLLPLLDRRRVLISLFVFLVTISTFILAEVKFGARTIKGILGIMSRAGDDGGDFGFALSTYFKRLVLQIHDNIFGHDLLAPIILFFLVGTAIVFVVTRKGERHKILFLLIWIFSTSILTIFGPPTLYYTNVGISPAVLLLASFFISRLPAKVLWAKAIVLVAIILSSLSLIKEQNPRGVISDIQVQEGILLGREKEVVDFIYESAHGKPIVVSALTMPLKISTTWAYLFNWYGKEKYGYLPYWAGEVALGYPGELPRWVSQEKDYAAFSIIEPTRGVRQAFVEQFLEDQMQYGGVSEEKTFGDSWPAQLVVQRRESTEEE